RLPPASLREVAVEQRHVLRHADARVDQDRIAAANQVRVGSRAGHHSRIEAEHTPDQVADRCGLWEVGIDPGHGSSGYTPRYRCWTSSRATSSAEVPVHTMRPFSST